MATIFKNQIATQDQIEKINKDLEKKANSSDLEDQLKSLNDELEIISENLNKKAEASDLEDKVDKDQFNSLNEELEIKFEKKVDKEVGKGLSSNNFTDEYKNKLDNLNYPLEVQKGGTGAITAEQARQNLGAAEAFEGEYVVEQSDWVSEKANNFEPIILEDGESCLRTSISIPFLLQSDHPIVDVHLPMTPGSSAEFVNPDLDMIFESWSHIIRMSVDNDGELRIWTDLHWDEYGVLCRYRLQ